MEIRAIFEKLDGVLAAYPDGQDGILTVYTAKPGELTKEAATRAVARADDMKLRKFKVTPVKAKPEND